MCLNAEGTHIWASPQSHVPECDGTHIWAVCIPGSSPRGSTLATSNVIADSQCGRSRGPSTSKLL